MPLTCSTVPPSSAGAHVDSLSYSLRRHYVDQFHFRHVPFLQPGSRVLDLGGNKTRKRGLFDIAAYPLVVVYADLSTAKHPDVQADATHVPFLDEQFDAVICSELLEHVLNPAAVLHDVHRILRQGGVLLLCAPFLHRIHGDPCDYGRYTDSYWAQTLAQLGFRQVSVEKQGLFWSVLVDMVREWAHEATTSRRPRPAWLRRGAAALVSWAWRRALLWDARAAAGQDPAFWGSFTTGFSVRAVKE